MLQNICKLELGSIKDGAGTWSKGDGIWKDQTHINLSNSFCTREKWTLYFPDRDVHYSVMAFCSVKKLLISTLCIHPEEGGSLFHGLYSV